ncbi:hypothetical protein CRE_22022 [Caenorhabditis remanei]|uniref:F-box domain-containing protein n=1 Tax=Caenorhabditis remanei TaxID=31234 RepID=E3N3F5_CAERE|nr:hypothetical protein CRE_22022 [Caenorhabditis remanei]
MSPFPLLRLPRLVLFDVFKSLNIGEKIKLSICSKKLSTQINNARLYSQKVIIDLDCINYKIRVHSENKKDTFEISIYSDSWRSHNSNTQQFSIACCTVKVVSIPTRIKTFWKNYREGYLSAIQHLLKMFHCKISTDIGYYNSDFYQPIITMLFDLQLEFKTLTINLHRLKNRELLWNQISSNLELVEDLNISFTVIPRFKPVFTSWPQTIYISNSYCLTLESLLACTCTTITLAESQLENKDLDVILRNWKVGGFPNLKYLKIHGQSITNNRTKILGMNLKELNGTGIQTDDGSKKAIIITDYGSIEMSVTSFENPRHTLRGIYFRID